MTDTAAAHKSRTADVRPLEDVDFAALTFHPQVLDGLRKSGFERPSPIQLRAIPLGRCGLDLIVQAKSGTGKTCVFTIVAVESLDMTSKRVQVLVLAPTREIAVQIQQVVMAIGSSISGLKCHVFIGGLPVSVDRQNLSNCHIAVGTPGRIKQLIEWQLLRTDGVRLLVLDEADKLLEEGSFQEQINWIYSTLPESKQMIAASATYPEALAEHVTKYMHNPTMVRLNAADPSLLGIKQFKKVLPSQPSMHLAYDVKVKHLLTLLTQVSFQQCLIFSNLQTRAENLSHLLCTRGWPSRYISGNQDQQLRLSVMSDLRASQCRILVATDLISRGIDVDKVNLVINLDVPKDYETYLHRIGRAGRFGSHGLAVTYIASADENAALRRLLANALTPVPDLPGVLPANFVDRPVIRQSDGSGDIDVGSCEVVETFQLTTAADVAANNRKVPANERPAGQSSGSSSTGPTLTRGNSNQQPHRQCREQPRQQFPVQQQPPCHQQSHYPHGFKGSDAAASSSHQRQCSEGDVAVDAAGCSVWDIVGTIRQYSSRKDGCTGSDNAVEFRDGVSGSCDVASAPLDSDSSIVLSSYSDRAESRVQLDLAPDEHYNALCRAVDDYLRLALSPAADNGHRQSTAVSPSSDSRSRQAVEEGEVLPADETANGSNESQPVTCDPLAGQQAMLASRPRKPARGSDLGVGMPPSRKNAIHEQRTLKKPRQEQRTLSQLPRHVLRANPRYGCGGDDAGGGDVAPHEFASQAIVCSRSQPHAALATYKESEHIAGAHSYTESDEEANSICVDSHGSSSDSESKSSGDVLNPVRLAAGVPRVPLHTDRLVQHYMMFAAADMYLRDMCAVSCNNKGN